MRIKVDALIKSIAVSPNDELLVLGTNDGMVSLRSTVSGRVERELKMEGLVEDLSFARNGAWVVAGSAEQAREPLRVAGLWQPDPRAAHRPPVARLRRDLARRCRSRHQCFALTTVLSFEF